MIYIYCGMYASSIHKRDEVKTKERQEAESDGLIIHDLFDSAQSTCTADYDSFLLLRQWKI